VPTAELALAAVHAAMASAASFAPVFSATPVVFEAFAFRDRTSHTEETTAMAAMGALSGIRTISIETVSLVFEHRVLLFDISNDIVS